jgi:hypothetical protein
VSLAPDGHHRCDRCDDDLGNGGVAIALVVSDLDPDRPGMIRNLHFCRTRVEVDDKGNRTTRRGCADVVLSDDNLAAYRTRQEETRGQDQ